MSQEAVVRAYFAAVNGRDAAALGRLLAPDAELETPAGLCRGPSEIVAFYAGHVFGAEDLCATPGPLLVAGDEVAVEIRLRMHGQSVRVADFFTVRGGRIARLRVYLLPATGARGEGG